MHSTPQQLSHLVTAVFEAWRQAGLEFLVLRNYQQLPAYTTNDIDVLVRKGQRRRAEELLVAAAQGAGFRLHNRGEFATLALYLSHRESNAQAHFDLFTDLKWRSFDFLQADAFLERRVDRGLFAVPHPAHEAATNLLAFLMYAGKVREKYRPGIAATFRAEPEAVRALLAQTYGPAQAEFLQQAGAAERWPELEARSGALRRTLVLRQCARRPWAVAKSVLVDGARLARRWVRPPGLSIVLCGADGCGKSTASAGIIEGLSGTCPTGKGEHFHWKPPVFSAGRRAARGAVTAPHAKPLRGALSSLAFFGVHWLEFVLGWFLRIRPITFRGGLALIDRFYYDFFVDQRRYRLRVPQRLVRLGYRLLPKPDLVLLLDAPPEVLQRRKQEVAPAETARQQKAYLALVQGLPNGVVIDASQPPEKVVAEACRAALDYAAQRQGRVKAVKKLKR